MKASLIFAIPALALTASAEPIPRMKRDTITLTSVAQNISDAMVKLDETVKPFGDDEVPVIRDVRTLIETLEAGAKHMTDLSKPISADEIKSLPNLLSTLKQTGKTLIEDLGQKKIQVERARLCGVANSQMLYANTLSGRLIDATLDKLPQAAQRILREQTEGLAQIIYQGAAVFGPSMCKNLVVEPSAPPAPVDSDTAFPTVQPPSPAAAVPRDDGNLRDIDPPSRDIDPPSEKREAIGENEGGYPVAPTIVETETSCTESDVYHATISTAYPTSDVPSTTISTTAILPSTVTISVNSTISTTTLWITSSTSAEATTVPTTLTSIDTTDCEDSVAPSTTSIPEATTVPTTVTSIDTTDCEESVAPSTTSSPVPTTVPTTLTSVDTTDCEESTPPIATPPVETPPPSTPIEAPSSFVTEPSSPPYPTSDFTSPPAGPTGSNYTTAVTPPSSSTPPPSPIPTAGAADTHVPVGLVAAVAAAMFLL